MTPDKLRQIASWLDTSDAWIEKMLGMVDFLDKKGNSVLSESDRQMMRDFVRGTEMQDDLREFADELERQ
jgi:hypothetical protein